jgi:hypothetical protein
MQVAWDNVPRHEQTIEALTLRMLKEENRNCIQGLMDEKEEKAFFSKSGQSSETSLAGREEKEGGQDRRTQEENKVQEVQQKGPLGA